MGAHRQTFAETWEDLDGDGRRALLVASNIKAMGYRKASPREPSVGLGAGDEPDQFMVIRGDLQVLLRLGKLAELRKRLAVSA